MTEGPPASPEVFCRGLFFAEWLTLGKEVVCQVPHSAKPALSKGHLCRVPNTRQRGTLGKRPLCRVSGTRQRITLGKIPHATPVAPPSSFAECWPLALGKRCVFAECCKPALGKEVPLPSANSDTRQSIFFYFCFQNFSVAFIQYLEAHIPIWNFSMIFLYIF